MSESVGLPTVGVESVRACVGDDFILARKTSRTIE